MRTFSTVVLAVLLCLIAILLGPVHITDGVPSPDCCVQNNIPSKCHFLCGTHRVGFFTTTRWTCTHKYYAIVKTCQVNNLYDYVKLFGHKLTQSVANGFEALSLAIKQKLVKAKDFVKLTIEELKQIPQDVLASLQDGLEYMTSGQFGGIVERLKYFTRQNLNAVLSQIPTKTFEANLGRLNIEVDFDNDQLRVLAEAGLRAFGKNVGNWSSTVLKKMNKLLAGLETSEIVDIAGDAIQLSHAIFCDVDFNDDQKNAFIGPAKKAFGELASWDEDAIQQVCKVLEVVPPTQLLQLSAKAVGKSAKFLSERKFFVPQARALVKKIKEAWGEVNSWDDVQLKNLSKLLKGLKKKEIASFLKDTVKKGLAEIGKIDWKEGQAREWIKRAKEILGNPDKWTVDNLKDLGQTAVALLPSDLQKIGNNTLYNALKYLKDVEVHFDQAQVIIQKIKGIKQLSQLTKDDLIAMQKVLDGFLSSDIGKLSQVAVTAAFPELIIAKKVGMPILRAFIEQFNKKPGDGKIGVLRGFAKALARIELNETDINEIVKDLQTVGLIDWDITQALELMQRIKREWGDFNGTDDDYGDKPTWGFQNFRKLGKIVVGLAKEDLRALPVRGIDDVIEVLGSNKGWTRGQILAAMKRVREYWEMEGLDLTNLTETDINGLGEFVTGLALSELKKLPEKILHTAVKRLGEKLDLPEDKLRARAFLSIELFKNQTGANILTSLQVTSLGGLLKGVNRAVLKKISKEGFLDNVYKITRVEGMSDDRLWEVLQLAKKHFGKSDVGAWLGEQWEDLGPALKTMDVGEFGRISKEAFDEVIDELGELGVFSERQARVLIAKAKEHWRQSDVSKWTGEQLRKLGSLVKGLNGGEIKLISKEFFEEAVGVWGERLDVTSETLVALAKRAKDVLVASDASKFVAEQLKMLGRVVLGLTAEDLEKLNINDIDIVAALGKWKGWTKDQLSKLGPKIQDFLNKAQKPDYYMSLGHLSPILQPSDIKRLNKRAFDLSAKLFGDNDGWTKEQLVALADKAKIIWGSIELWEKAQISELGNIVEGLKPLDLSKLRSAVVDAIKPSVIKKLEGEQLKAFTPDQINSMDASQVNMINDAAVGFLTAEQRDAVENVKASDPADPNPWPQESCAGPNCPVSGKYHLVPNLILLMAAILWYFKQS